jgi:hypothetical protein
MTGQNSAMSSNAQAWRWPSRTRTSRPAARRPCLAIMARSDRAGCPQAALSDTSPGSAPAPKAALRRPSVPARAFPDWHLRTVTEKIGQIARFYGIGQFMSR